MCLLLNIVIISSIIIVDVLMWNTKSIKCVSFYNLLTCTKGQQHINQSVARVVLKLQMLIMCGWTNMSNNQMSVGRWRVVSAEWRVLVCVSVCGENQRWRLQAEYGGPEVVFTYKPGKRLSREFGLCGKMTYTLFLSHFGNVLTLKWLFTNNDHKTYSLSKMDWL